MWIKREKNLHHFSRQQIHVLWWAKGGIFGTNAAFPFSLCLQVSMLLELKSCNLHYTDGTLLHSSLFLWCSCSSDFWKMFGITAGHDRILPKLESGSKYLPAIRLCHMPYSYSWPGKENARILNICRYSIKMSALDTHLSGFCLPHI